jgi:dihydroneopterin aldolase
MYTIHLQDLRFNGFHGLYEAEKRLGNEFEVNVSIQVDEDIALVSPDRPSLDYVHAYDIIRQCMEQPTPLLEQLGNTIALHLMEKFSMAKQVHISIYKLHAPIPSFEGKVGVEFVIDR